MPKLAGYRPLRLFAADAEDLKVVSAMLQDSIVKIGDFSLAPKERRFAFVASRFVWECAGARGPFARVRAGCHFDDVRAVRQTRLRTDARDAVVELLAIRFDPAADGAGTVTLDFAGGGAIRLDVDCVNAHLSDISAPWATRLKPDHDRQGRRDGASERG
jgi:hypothetical protein